MDEYKNILNYLENNKIGLNMFLTSTAIGLMSQ
jgi:hypothetical protein